MDRHNGSQDDLKSHTGSVRLTINAKTFQLTFQLSFQGHVSGAKADKYFHGGHLWACRNRAVCSYIHSSYLLKFHLDPHVLCMYTW
jgi:hypothetical protein